MQENVVVMPLYQFTAEHAPHIVNKDEFITCPDLICFGKSVFFAEVKTKQRWINFNGVLETGIDYKHYLQYKKAAEITNIKVFLFFRHLVKKPLGVFSVELNTYTRYWDGKTPTGKYIKEPMVLWDKEKLLKLN